MLTCEGVATGKLQALHNEELLTKGRVKTDYNAVLAPCAVAKAALTRTALNNTMTASTITSADRIVSSVLVEVPKLALNDEGVRVDFGIIKSISGAGAIEKLITSILCCLPSGGQEIAVETSLQRLEALKKTRTQPGWHQKPPRTC